MSSEKKVLIVTALTGFVRAFLVDDIKILQSMGYNVVCAANSAGDDRSLEQNIEYFKQLDVRFVDVPFSSNDPFSWQNLKAYCAVKKLLKKERFCLVHVHTPIPGVFVRWAAKKYRKNTKIIYTTHGFYFHEKSSKKNWIIFYNVEKFMSRFGDAIITINKEDYNNAKTMYSPEVFRINGVGVDTKKFINTKVDKLEYRKMLGLKEDDKVILSVGELSDRKNHQIIIKALAELNDPSWIYLIVGRIIKGQGTYEALTKLASDLNVRVDFLGYRRDIPELSKCADMGALPSSREGLGLAGIEMLASGNPVVASNIHGIKDYIQNGSTGYLADPYDEKSFADAILQTYDLKRKSKTEIKCIEKASMFDKEVSHKQRLDIYQKFLKD